MILETTRTAHPDYTALHFRYQHTPLGKHPLKISVTRKRLPSRITCNGLRSKDPLAYDKAMKLLALVTVMLGCLSLAGCVTTSGKDYALTPTPKLCMDYLMQRGLLKDLKNKGREETLAMRGEDCSSYMDAARQMRLEEKRLFIQGAAAAQKTNMDLFQMGNQLKQHGRPYILK